MADLRDDTTVLSKRPRVDPNEYVPNSSPAKLPRVPEAVPGAPDLVRVDSVDSINSVCDPGQMADLLGMFEVPDSVGDPELDSVVRSLQEEIMVASAADAGDPTADIRYGNELGYLLEASDDELGLPPRNSPPGSSAGADGIGDVFGFDGENRVYDLSELGIGAGDWDDNGGAACEDDGGTDFVAFDGLFDQEPENSKLTWQPESVSAL